MCLKNIQDDFKNLSGSPWEYLFQDGAHYIIAGCTRKTIAVFADEKNARLLVEILSNLPELLEEHEESHTEEEYSKLVEQHDDLEKKLAEDNEELGEAVHKTGRYEILLDEARESLELFDNGKDIDTKMNALATLVKDVSASVEMEKRLDTIEAVEDSE